jgi:hypothetical protein
MQIEKPLDSLGQGCPPPALKNVTVAFWVQAHSLDAGVGTTFPKVC